MHGLGAVGDAGRRRIGRGNASPLRGPAKSSMWPNVGATHWVALGANAGRDKQIAMHGLGGRRRAPPGRARRCLAPTRSGQKLHVAQRRGDPLGRPRSFMPTRSFTAGTNKSRGMASRGGRRRAPPGRARRCLAPTVWSAQRVLRSGWHRRWAQSRRAATRSRRAWACPWHCSARLPGQ